MDLYCSNLFLIDPGRKTVNGNGLVPIHKKSSTDGVFKNELTRATGSIIDYLNSDEDTTAAEMIEKLEDLRDYIDDSIEQTGIKL